MIKVKNTDVDVQEKGKTRRVSIIVSGVILLAIIGAICGSERFFKFIPKPTVYSNTVITEEVTTTAEDTNTDITTTANEVTDVAISELEDSIETEKVEIVITEATTVDNASEDANIEEIETKKLTELTKIEFTGYNASIKTVSDYLTTNIGDKLYSDYRLSGGVSYLWFDTNQIWYKDPDISNLKFTYAFEESSADTDLYIAVIGLNENNDSLTLYEDTFNKVSITKTVDLDISDYNFIKIYCKSDVGNASLIYSGEVW